MIQKRTHWMSFALAITVVLFVVVPDAIAQIPSDCLGRIWHITEGDATWAGTWTRRGNTNIFDAYWKRTTGEEQRAVLTMEVSGSQVVINCGNDRYSGTLSSDCRTIEGTASWYQSWMKWSAVIVPDDIPTVPKGTAAPCFGQVWHVTEGRRELEGHVDEKRKHKRLRRILEKDDGGRTACRAYDGGQRQSGRYSARQ